MSSAGGHKKLLQMALYDFITSCYLWDVQVEITSHACFLGDTGMEIFPNYDCNTEKSGDSTI